MIIGGTTPTPNGSFWCNVGPFQALPLPPVGEKDVEQKEVERKTKDPHPTRTKERMAGVSSAVEPPVAAPSTLAAAPAAPRSDPEVIQIQDLPKSNRMAKHNSDNMEQGDVAVSEDFKPDQLGKDEQSELAEEEIGGPDHLEESLLDWFGCNTRPVDPTYILQGTNPKSAVRSFDPLVTLLCYNLI